MSVAITYFFGMMHAAVDNHKIILTSIGTEELFAGFSTLSGVTGNTAEVSTQLSAILRGLVKQTDFSDYL